MILKKDYDQQFNNTSNEAVFLNDFVLKTYSCLAQKSVDKRRVKRGQCFQVLSWYYKLNRDESKILLKVLRDRGLIVIDNKGILLVKK